MDDLLDSIDRAIGSQNYFAALFVALTLPDVCGRVEFPQSKGSQDRYERWVKDYLHTLPNTGYSQMIPSADLYALRCALLHEARADISAQKAREILDYYVFISGSGSHLNKFANQNNNGKVFLQVSVEIFCADIKTAAESWLKSVAGDRQKQQQLDETIEIHPAGYTTMGVTFF